MRGRPRRPGGNNVVRKRNRRRARRDEGDRRRELLGHRTSPTLASRRALTIGCAAPSLPLLTSLRPSVCFPTGGGVLLPLVGQCGPARPEDPSGATFHRTQTCGGRCFDIGLPAECAVWDLPPTRWPTSLSAGGAARQESAVFRVCPTIPRQGREEKSGTRREARQVSHGGWVRVRPRRARYNAPRRHDGAKARGGGPAAACRHPIGMR